MNKRELIEHINNTLFHDLKDTLFTDPTLSITESAKDNKVTIKFETEQGGAIVGGMLKKIEKVTVPQFVADWIEECKNNDFHLFGAMEGISSNQKKLDYWFREDDNMELFARAWLDGYEVDKEKRYLVKIKNIVCENILIYGKNTKRYYFSPDINPSRRGYHTRKELEEAGFGEVFSSPLFEVEEVEE